MVSEGGGGIGISDPCRKWRGGQIDIGWEGGGLWGAVRPWGITRVRAWRGVGRGAWFGLFHLVSPTGGITDHG